MKVHRGIKNHQIQHIIYVLETTGISGGIRVVFEQANRLAAQGFHVEIYSLQKQPNWFQLRVQVRQFPNYETLGRALYEQRAIKIATYWKTASVVASNSSRGEGFYFVQDIESCFYENEYQQQCNVLNTYQLPLNLICESLWVRDELTKLGRKSLYIGIGIDHNVFKPNPLQSRKPYQVLVNAPRNGVLRHLKGIDILTDALTIVAQNFTNLEIVSFSSSNQPLEIPGVQVTHFTRPSDQIIASLYNEAACIVIASRHEGFCLPALEAMSCGCAVIITKAGGNEEFCLHEKTCLLVESENANALAQATIRILSDKTVADKIRDNGLAMSRTYEWQNPIHKLIVAIRSPFGN